MEQHERPEVVPGERIFLTTLRREDVPLLTHWFSDLEMTAYLGRIGVAHQLEQEQDWYDRQGRSENTITFGIVVRESQRLIGTVGLMDIDPYHGRATLGITIGDKSAWGRGYGTEAVRLMAEYGCFFKNLESINLSFVAFNERGHRAYLKAGFKEAGRWRKAYRIGGERYDSVWMDITRDELDLSRMRALIGQLGARDDA
jgi:RimJ/RimL family protein N-acetyltransferase